MLKKKIVMSLMKELLALGVLSPSFTKIGDEIKSQE